MLDSVTPTSRPMVYVTSITALRSRKTLEVVRFDLRNYSPKTKRPNSSPSRLDSAGSFEARKR